MLSSEIFYERFIGRDFTWMGKEETGDLGEAGLDVLPEILELRVLLVVHVQSVVDCLLSS